MGYGDSEAVQRALPILLVLTDKGDGRAVLPEVQEERYRADRGGRLGAGCRRRPRLVGGRGGDGRGRPLGGGGRVER